MAIAIYFIPYVIHLFVALIIVTICFLKFKSLRKFRRKRNILLYVILALTLSAFAYKTYDEFLGPTIVTFSLASEPFFANRVNPIEVTVENLGMRQKSFFLVLKSINATLTANSPDIIQLNNTSIKIPFNLHSVHEEMTKTVHFQMDDNVTGCSFYPSIERTNHSPIVTGGTYRAESVWNSRTGRYTLNLIMGPVI